MVEYSLTQMLEDEIGEYPGFKDWLNEQATNGWTLNTIVGPFSNDAYGVVLIRETDKKQQAESQEPEFHRVKEQDCYSRIRRDLESIEHTHPVYISRIKEDIRQLFGSLQQSMENANRKAVEAHKEKCRFEEMNKAFDDEILQTSYVLIKKNDEIFRLTEEVKSLKAEMREMNEELNDPTRVARKNSVMDQLLSTIRELANLGQGISNENVCDIAIPWLTAVVRQEKSTRDLLALRDKQIEDMDKKLDDAFGKLQEIGTYATHITGCESR